LRQRHQRSYRTWKKRGRIQEARAAGTAIRERVARSLADGEEKHARLKSLTRLLIGVAPSLFSCREPIRLLWSRPYGAFSLLSSLPESSQCSSRS
jgi:hypothetical protein